MQSRDPQVAQASDAAHVFYETKVFFYFSKTEFFCTRYFLKTKRKPTKSITEQCFSCQHKSVCQKLAAQNENLLKNQYTPFLHEALQLESVRRHHSKDI